LQDAQWTIAPENRYRGFCDCIRRTYKEQGLKSLWRGNGANVLRYFPYQAMNFTLKDIYKKILITYSENGDKNELRSILLTNVASGGVAGATALSIVYPLEFARTRLALDVGHNNSREFNGIKDCFAKIFRSDGVRGFYKY
uniref:ADP/ATP translocase n=1 Tax=Romanomermis culicivorax TaxID=13658 RepID=A0A915JCQ9_ROMCU